jgi:hypothetical protein
MPLIHSKKPAAFKENIRKEVHAGKPVKQAVAIAYSVKRKAEHKADGGMCECQGKGCAKCMDEGGSVSGAQSTQDSMRKAFHYKDGGRIKGVHEQNYPGESEAGDEVVRSNEYKQSGNPEHLAKSEEHMDRAKTLHKRKLWELQSMPNPKLKGLAHGGEVEPSDDDHEIHEMLGSEMMDAIHSKDHKKLMQGIEAMVLHHMSKKED